MEQCIFLKSKLFDLVQINIILEFKMNLWLALLYILDVITSSSWTYKVFLNILIGFMFMKMSNPLMLVLWVSCHNASTMRYFNSNDIIV